jgi:RNA polymerase sigma-70 factor (ECF subfamily)
LDDAAAIRSCRGGDADAFRHLVERYQNQALAHAAAILGNRTDAEDALQEALLDAYRALDRFDERRSFYPWFYTILRNRCWKLAANRGKESTAADSLAILAASRDHPPEHALALDEALGKLPPESRELLTLRHLDGLSYEELSRWLEIPVGTVMSRLFHARKHLRTNLGGKQ